MTAIVLGADSPIGLTVIRELGSRGIAVHAVGRDRRSIGGASRFATSRSARPDGAVADWLPALIERTGARALFAISEADLVALSHLPETIAGCAILTPRPTPLSIVLDKSATLRAAAAVGIDVPESWQPDSTVADERGMSDLSYPVVLKWADSTATRPLLTANGLRLEKSEFATDPAALAAALHRYDAIGRWPLVQAYCPGYGFAQMLHMHDGRATLRFQHRRLREWPPAGGVSTLCEAVDAGDHREQMARSEALLRSIRWEGPAMVEYRHDPLTGRYWLMEVNGRLWGSLPLASASGAAFAWEQYRTRILGERTAARAPRTDLRARYLIPDSKRLVRVVLHPGAIGDPAFAVRPVREVAAYLRSFLDRRTRHYVFRRDDPRPMLRDLANIVRKLAGPADTGGSD